MGAVVSISELVAIQMAGVLPMKGRAAVLTKRAGHDGAAGGGPKGMVIEGPGSGGEGWGAVGGEG